MGFRESCVTLAREKVKTASEHSMLARMPRPLAPAKEATTIVLSFQDIKAFVSDSVPLKENPLTDQYCGINPRVISCYTFGAPRVGNHAFAAEYAENVPNTWQIVNDLDAVPRVPKFHFMFKHVGRRLIINEDGDIILCPLFVEV
ncbi:hypothetical protein BSKO_10794 [Bryopsis sp. KO-2023]|nr:hypothetical protein BSKO_10794 [Bryopsis sp. KO-2023]